MENESTYQKCCTGEYQTGHFFMVLTSVDASPVILRDTDFITIHKPLCACR